MRLIPETYFLKKPSGFTFRGRIQYLILFFCLFLFTPVFSQEDLPADTLQSSSHAAVEIVLTGDARIISADVDFNKQIRDRRIVVRNSYVTESHEKGALMVMTAMPEVQKQPTENTLQEQHREHLAEVRQIGKKIKEKASEYASHIQNGDIGHLTTLQPGTAHNGVLFIPNLLFLHTKEFSFAVEQNYYYARRFYCGPLLSTLECLNSRLFARPPPYTV